MSKKPTSYADVLKQKEQTQQLVKPKINLFDFSGVKTQQPIQTPQLNFGQPVSQRNVTNFGDYKQTIPQVQTQPTQTSGFSLIPTASAEEKDLIQTFLDDNSVNVENRKTVFEMLKDNVPKNVIEDAIINKAGYKGTQPTQESFIEGVGTKTKESFLGGIKRIGEAGVGLAEGKYNIPEAFARGGAGALQSAFSPVAGVLGETIETGIEKIPQDFKDYISTKTKPTINDVKTWYDTQTPYQKRQLQNIGVGVELLANFVGAGAVQKATPVVKQGVVKTGEQVLKGGKQVLKPITEPVNTIIKQGKTLLGKPDEIQGIQQAIKPYVKVKDGKVVRSNEQIVNEIKRANELIKQSGDTPTDLLTYRQSIEKQLKGLGEQISTKTKQPLEVDLSETSSKLRELANKKTVGLLDKGESQKLTALADDLEKSGKIGVSEAEYMNQFINDTLRNIPNVSETYKRGLNILVKDLREKLDATLSTIPGEFKQIKKDYGALRNLLGDTVKREIVYNRQNPEGLITGIGKMEGLGNIGGGILKILGLDVKGGVSDIGKGLIQNKVGTFIKTKNDPNYIIKQIFSNKGKDVNNVNINIPSTAKSNIGTSKNIGEVKQIKPSILSDREKSLLKPNQPKNEVSNPTTTKTSETGRKVLKPKKSLIEKLQESPTWQKVGEKVDEYASKVGAKKNLLGGEGAKSAPKSGLELAKSLEGKYDADVIWEKTGWEKGTDGKWRFEIDDSKAEINFPNFDKKEFLKSKFPNTYGKVPTYILEERLTQADAKKLFELEDKGRGGFIGVLSDFLKHKDLFKHYPELKNINIYYEPYLGKTGANINGNIIRLGDLKNNEQVKGLLLHEIQHSIQEKGGFARGGNIADEGSFEAYERLAGETEARNVQTRLLKTPSERKLLRPAKTEDVARDKQIVKMEGGKSMFLTKAEKIGAKKNLLPRSEKQVGDDLIEQAKKYKTFDEFKKSQGQELYHGTPVKFDEFDLSHFGKSDKGFAGKGVYLTNDKLIAKEYADTWTSKAYPKERKGYIMNVYTKTKNPLIVNSYEEIGKKLGIKGTELTSYIDNGKISKIAQEKGYDSLIIKDFRPDGSPVNEIVIFDTKNIKTEAQLKQIYEQANKPKLLKPSSVSKVEKQVGDDLISEARKFKSVEEFEKSYLNKLKENKDRAGALHNKYPEIYDIKEVEVKNIGTKIASIKNEQKLTYIDNIEGVDAPKIYKNNQGDVFVYLKPNTDFNKIPKTLQWDLRSVNDIIENKNIYMTNNGGNSWFQANEIPIKEQLKIIYNISKKD